MKLGKDKWFCNLIEVFFFVCVVLLLMIFFREICDLVE